MNKVNNILRVWLPLAVAISGLSALVYVTVQQVLRQGANDPQIQLAQDAAAALDAGHSPDAVLPAAKVDIASSQAPFVIIYDMAGKPVASSGSLDGQMPDYPLGALQAAKSSSGNRVTWQPRPDVRIASVAVPYKGGYVVAGRSLHEVEQRESQTRNMVLVMWLITLVAALAVTAFAEYVLRS